MAQIPGYSLIRNDREGRSSGGIALDIRDNLKYKIIEMIHDMGQMKLPEYVTCNFPHHDCRSLQAS